MYPTKHICPVCKGDGIINLIFGGMGDPCDNCNTEGYIMSEGIKLEPATKVYDGGLKVTMALRCATPEELERAKKIMASTPKLTMLENEIADCFDIQNSSQIDVPKLRAILTRLGVDNK